MRKVVILSVFLFAGLVLSQILPGLLGNVHGPYAAIVRLLTTIGLAFIMMRVGFEFRLDKSRLLSYGWDYVVAFIAASLPWILVSCYFVFILLPSTLWGEFDAWKETLLAGRFAAPTSAGVLFSMLVAAGLGSAWLFRKARVLAIFDDLDTVLLMIPLKMLIVGVAWQLGLVVFIMMLMLVAAYIWLHAIKMPVSWPWVLLYSSVIVAVSELLYAGSKVIDPSIPIHIEVLLPAFVLGCLARPFGCEAKEECTQRAFEEVLDQESEKKAGVVISTLFMLLVGLSMPALFHDTDDSQHPAPLPETLYVAAPPASINDSVLGEEAEKNRFVATITGSQPAIGWGAIVIHIIMITLVSNLGKMFPAFCYRKEAHWRHRLALAVGMWPRGEVGAGVIVLSFSYGIGGPIVIVAMGSLALNLALTGVFIFLVKKIIDKVPESPVPSA